MAAPIGQGIIVLLNLRAVVSFFGIATINWFSWQWERKWEQCGPEQSKSTPDAEEGGSSDYQNMDEEGGNVFTTTFNGKKLPPYNKFALAGWVVLALSHIFPRFSWVGVEFTALNLSALVLVALVGYVQAVFVPQAIVERRFAAKKLMWNGVSIVGSLLLGIFTYLQNSVVPFYVAPVSALAVSLAPLLLWKSRLVGETFDKESRINPQPELFNFGGPVLMFGWFWYWIAMNMGVEFDVGRLTAAVHVYFGYRLLIAMGGAILVVFVYWVVGYGLDEIENLSGEPDSPQALMNSPAFGSLGFFCGEVYEIKVFNIIAWAAMGLCVFFPYNFDDFLDWVFMAACTGVGLSFSLINENGLRLQDTEVVKSWTTRSYALLGIIAILVPFQAGLHYSAVILSVAGAFMTGYGTKMLHQDRKRGAVWLETGEVQTPTVYSYGVLLFPLGMVVFAWAASMHPGNY